MLKSSVRLGILALAMVCLLFTAQSALAQTGTTSLRGTVLDKSGAAIADAKVTLNSPELSIHREATTGKYGDYEFLALPPGTYTLTVEKVGFRKFDERAVALKVNTPETINPTLEVGASTETIEVSAQTEVLNTTDASLGNAFGENQIKQLPLDGRNVPDLLTLQAGVTYVGNRVNDDTDTRSGAVNGARSDQSNVTLEGLPVNDSGGHAFTSVLPVTPDSVQEFRVTTSNYNADQGGAGGAQVALVTRSGTNQFHGSAYEYHRNTLTSANDYFIKRSQIQTCLDNGTPLDKQECNNPSKLIRNVFGASLGGPIIKDRLFLFLNYEGTRRAEASAVDRTVPSSTLRDGVIIYGCDPTDPNSALLCNGQTVQGLSGTTYQIPTGHYGLNQSTLKTMDPLGIGINPVMIQYFQDYPQPNDLSGGDGYNFVGYRFQAPIHDNRNWYIAKLDYNITRDSKQHISVFGALANESNPQEAFLPGQPPENSYVTYNKGIIVNYNAVLTNSLVNNLRYGYLRESYGNIGNSNQPYITIRSLSQGVTYSSASQRPVNLIADDLSWTKGRHSFQFGTSLGFYRNPRQNTTGSFSDGIANASWIDTSGFLVKNGSPFSPGYTDANNNRIYPNLPLGDPGFANAYDFPLMGLLGMVTEVDATYNYLKNGTVLPQGAPVTRHFAFNSYEFYAQDSWKVKPNLTLTFGLRYSYFPPPWETNGLQVAPNQSLSEWFNLRGHNMVNGIPSSQDPLISFDLAGPANPGGKPGLYEPDKANFAPRFAFAYSPNFDKGLLGSTFGGQGKTTIRGGFAMVYDRISSGLLDTFNSSGSFGLATTLSNPAGIETAACSPRLTSINTIPQTDNCGNQIFIPAPPGTYPQTFPSSLDSGGFAIYWGLDNKLKSPYAYTLDLSIGRELGGGFSVEASYVGRLSHRLLAQSDLAMPLNFKDPKSGVSYFDAITALAKLYRPQSQGGQGVPSDKLNTASLPANIVNYWTNMLQPLQSGDAYSIGNCVSPGGATSTTNPVVAVYDFFCGGNLNETTPLFLWDYFGISGVSGNSYYPTPGPNTFYDPQFSSLYGWRSDTKAWYHGLQVTVRHAMRHGLQFDFNYTFSKSLDIFSDATRVGAWGGLGGQIINSWDPFQQKGVSDFDARHQINGNFLYELPFGRGKAFGSSANGFTNAIIGGWQLSGLYRWTSGFPVNVANGYLWPTNWQLGGNAILTGHVSTGSYILGGTSSQQGTPTLFSNGSDAIYQFSNPYPGQGGARNQIRGPGYFGIDAGLSKRWTMPWSEKQSLQFRWEVFNVTNSKRFNVQSISAELDIQGSFGNYNALLTNPRVMQFGLRYDF